MRVEIEKEVGGVCIIKSTENSQIPFELLTNSFPLYHSCLKAFNY